MSLPNINLEELHSELLRLSQDTRLPFDVRMYFLGLADKCEQGTYELVDELIAISNLEVEDALNYNLRGADYSGDMVGRPADELDGDAA